MNQQHDLILKSLKFLAGRCDGAAADDGQGFNGIDSPFGHALAAKTSLSPRQVFSAYKMMKKYWRQLKKADPSIVLPKTFQHYYELEGMIVHNLSKGTEYQITEIGDDDYSCTCDAYQYGNECSHIKYFREVSGPGSEEEVVEVEATPPITIIPAPQVQPEEPALEMLPGITATSQQSIALKELMAFANGSDSIHGLFGFAGTGKLQPLTEPVLTPDGWVPMGEINAGDFLISKDGSPTKVLQTFPGSDLDIYKVSFCDGTFTYCCKDHLWQVSTAKLRSQGKHKVMSLAELLPKLHHRDASKQYYYSIPLADPVQFSKKDLAIPPYLLGWLIGDGCLSTPKSDGCTISVWTKDIQEVSEALSIEAIPLGQKISVYDPSPSSPNVARIRFPNTIKPLLEGIGLLGKYSKDKFIPKQYMLGSIEQRKALLAGLLDTDGSVKRTNDRRVRTAFYTSSNQLAENVAELVRSLGGYSKVSTQCKKRPNELKVAVRLWFNPFRLERKRKEYGNYQPTVSKCKKIVDAKYIGKMDGQCILVDHPSHLYLTRHYIVTHNTLLLQAWIKHLRDGGYTKPIVFTAPTNKAVGVLQRMADQWNLDIDCVTCAKLLGLKPHIDPKSGSQFFKPDFGEEPTIDEYSIVVIDECSMVNSADIHDGLWEYLTASAGLFTKLLFVGDYAQLPPVNEPISKVFLEVHQPSTLTEVRRYGGVIGLIATELRENLSRKNEPYFETSYNQGKTNGLFVFDSKQRWESNIVKAFQSENYQLDPNYSRCLAWTNRRVKEINNMIRNEIRGTKALRFVEGERLIMSQHFVVDQVSTPIPTSQEMEVISAEEGTSGEWGAWFLSVRLFNRAGTRKTIPVLHENSFTEFESKQQKSKKAKDWRTFYGRKGAFAWLDYAYSTTVHKAQGSTFNNVFADAADICRNKTQNTFTWPDGKKQRVWERNQLLYVAITRASDRVFIYE